MGLLKNPFIRSMLPRAGRIPRLSMMWVGNVGWLVFIVLMTPLMLAGHEKPAS